ncbi:calcium-binding protein 7-like [Silurus meridionalis]|nr:calcium-binding protein 7-like [Silurus meridionalis]
MHPVTSTLMYRGICTIPDILSYGTPVNLPEDEVEVVSIYQKFSKQGTVVNRRQDNVRPKLIDACGDRRLVRVVRSNRRAPVAQNSEEVHAVITQWVSTILAAKGGPRQYYAEIREAFKVFDRDGNGFISKQELGMAMRSLGYMPNEVELEVIIQRLDMDGDGQVDFEEFVTLLGPKISAAGMPDKFNGTDFDSVFWKCDMQKLTVDELKRLLYETFCDHLTMKDIETIIMTEENHIENPEDCQVDIDSESPTQQVKQTCVRKSLICAFAIAFIISVMLIAANQVLRSGMK